MPSPRVVSFFAPGTSNDTEVLDQDATPQATESDRSGEALTGWTGDGETRVALATFAKTGEK